MRAGVKLNRFQFEKNNVLQLKRPEFILQPLCLIK